MPRKEVAVVFIYYGIEEQHSEVYKVTCIFWKYDHIWNLYLISKYAVMEVFSMGGNVHLSQPERCKLCVMLSEQ